MGHAIGENSMEWGSEAPINGTDPLSKCQQILRSPVMEQYLDAEKHCREFVDFGNYPIVLRDANRKSQRFYRFSRYRVSLMAVRYGDKARNQVIGELGSRFARLEDNRVWRGRDGAIIEIEPGEQMSLLTGGPENSDGFLVVISAAEP